jgi:integrase/recombinase XerD
VSASDASVIVDWHKLNIWVGPVLPVILTQEEAVRLIDSASNLFHRAMLMTLYSTGMRRAELCHLKVEDIDGERMIVHIRHGKRNRGRDVPLSPKLLETLREYWRWMRPKTYLFPGTENGWRADKPITPKVLWQACREAAQRAGITKAVRPHLIRTHSRLTCWKEERTCPLCSCCSVTPTSKPLPFIFISPSGI